MFTNKCLLKGELNRNPCPRLPLMYSVLKQKLAKRLKIDMYILFTSKKCLHFLETNTPHRR